MEETYVHIAAILFAVIAVGIAVFQVLLTLGYPLGEALMGGKYKVFPKPLRIASAFSALVLLFMGFVFLEQAKVVSIPFFSTHILVWIFTIYLGINTLGNLASKSKKERLIMTPISTIAFLLGLVVAFS